MEEMVLIEKLCKRDPKALSLLYNEYRDRVFAVARRIVRDDWDAEEVVQDVFWIIHRKIELFRKDSSLWSWVYRIAVNAAKMKVRKYKRYPIPLENEVLWDLSAGDNSDTVHTQPDEHLAYKQLIEQLSGYLDNTNDKNRQLYIDMEFSGLSKENVAQNLDLSIPAVKTRLHRMRVGLRDHLTTKYQAAYQ